MRLAAGNAARCFASSRRGAERASRAVWIPLVLRWRRKRKQAATARAERGANPAAASVAWHAQFHLHFGVLASDRSRREESHPYAPAAVIREMQRSLVHRLSTSVRMATLATQTRVTDRATHVLAVRGVAPLTTHAAAKARPAAMSAVPAILPRADRRERPLFESPRTVIRARGAEGERTQPSARRTAIAPRELRVTHLHLSRFSAEAARREGSTQAPVRIVRPQALVWRTAQQPQAESARQATLANPAMTFSRPPARPAAAQEPAPETTRRAARGTLQVSDLDPALLERLTDDVIRRVERRVRIERERRGL